MSTIVTVALLISGFALFLMALSTLGVLWIERTDNVSGKRKAIRNSTSFRDDEVMLMAEILEGLLWQKDVSQLVRHSAFAGVMRKFQRMKRSVIRRRQGEITGDSQTDS